MRLSTSILLCVAFVALASCHGHGSSSATSAAGSNVIAAAAANVAAATVKAGPGPNVAINTLYTTVKICAPGSTTNCQSIDDIAIDTSSSGLRIMGSVLAPTLAAALPIQVDASNNAIYECAEYADGVAWGPTAVADMSISGEAANSLPIQVITNAAGFTIPAACASAGAGNSLQTVASLGANGTLGVSVFAQDCGSACSLSDTLNAGFYYACSASASPSCNVTTVPLTGAPALEQIQNPVTLFATDNTGVIVEMPAVAAGGASSAAGALVFGIDTQTDNASNTLSTVMTLDAVHGYVSTTLNNTAYGSSFFDTGASALFFDSTTSEPTLTPCTDTANSAFYCPGGTESFSAVVVSSGDVPINVPFSVASADSLLTAAGTSTAFSNLAGSAPSGVFDWGMPFFYGRNIYFAIQGKATILGVGPYVAF